MITAETDNFSSSQGVALVVNVADLLANDSGGAGPLTVVGVSSENIPGMYDYGRPKVFAQLRGDGTILFTPEPSFQGNAKFSYSVSDGTTTSTGELYLSVTHSDDAPAFTSAATFSVLENSTKVGTVTAIGNAGGPVTYSLTAGFGYYSYGFTINSKTGAIGVDDSLGSRGLDYEMSTSYSLSVVATNAAGSTVQTVTINLIDIEGQVIRGTSGNDWINRTHEVGGKFASDDGDRINGMKGNDRINGLRGDDTLIGGPGNDTLRGGEGRDSFVFKSKLGADNVDRITDFFGIDDRIQLDNEVMVGLGTRTGELRASQYYRTFDGSAQAHDRSDRIIYDEHTHKLYYDADGTGSVEAVLIAIFDASALVMWARAFEIV
jgi:Ca2+-binding RTX toxin-like protein